MPRFIFLKFILSLLFIASISFNAKSQKIEGGILVGGSYYYGDLVNDLQLSTISVSGGVFIRQHINENFSIKYFGGYCRINGADSLSPSKFQKHRNLSFWADVFEGSVQAEYSLVKDITRGRILRNRFIPYIFAGVGAFYFQNYAYDPSHTVMKLWQLGTSGVTYNNYALCVPFGGGVRYKVTSTFSIGFEVGARYTSTNWLDDVGGKTSIYAPKNQLPLASARIMSDRSIDQGYLYSGQQRGKISTNDVYVMGGLTLTYRFGLSGGGGYRGRAIRCPRFY